MAVVLVLQLGNVSLATRAGLGVGARLASGEAEMGCAQVVAVSPLLGSCI